MKDFLAKKKSVKVGVTMPELAILSKSDEQRDEETDRLDFEAIFEAFYTRIYNFNYYRIQKQAVAEDLTSITFEKAFIKIHTFDSKKSSLEVWLFAIARNVLKDYFRSQKRHPLESLDQVFETIVGDSSLEAHVIANEQKEKLLFAVRKLKDKERALIAYKYGAGLKNKEIAVLTGMKEKTVSANLCRILKKMRSDLQEESYEE